MAEIRDQVVFDSVAKSYPTDAHVECRYTMKPTHYSTTYDWIGLFKVGWANQKEFIFYHWVPYPKDRAADEECSYSILFQSMHLPKEDGEYYQFVYFNDKGKMCGASSPFYFLVPRNEDIIEEVMQEDADMLYITTKRGQLEEKKLECAKLEKTCEAMDQEIRGLSEQLKAVDDSRAVLELENSALNDKLMVLEGKSDLLILADRRLVEKETYVEELKVQLVQLQEEINTLKVEQALLLDQIKLAEDNTVEEVEALKKRLEEAVPDKEAYETLQAQLSSSQETIDSLQSRKRQQKEIIDEQHNRLQATEARHAVDMLEINTLNETLTNLSLKVEEVNTTNEELKTKLGKLTSQYEAEKSDWEATLAKMEMDKNSLLSSIGELNHKLSQLQDQTVSAETYDIQEDRYIALQAAYMLLKDELREQKKNLATLQRREQRHRVASTAKLDELTGKLKESQEEYTKLGAQKIKLEKRLKIHKAGGASVDTSPLKRSLSAASRDDLTKEELQKMVEQLSGELESRTQKKDRYKDKYLDEKQRAATMRDYYKAEADKLRADLALARSQLDVKVTTPPAHVGPIVYPDVPASKANKHGRVPQSRKSRPPSGAGDKSAKGALEQSIVEDHTDQLTPLPAPLEPTKTHIELKMDNLSPQATSNPHHSVDPHPSAIIYPMDKKVKEEVVMPLQSDSDEDNDGADRFHDASDVPTSMIKCFICDKVFDLHDSEEMRNAHACEHLDATATVVSVENYQCPICKQEFPKIDLSLDDMQAHVNAHFTNPM